MLSVLLSSMVAIYPPGYDLPLYMHRHEVKNARARNAVCNDGSPAVFYYRGCNETYYKNDLGGCINISSIWSVMFESAEEYCYNAATCKSRAERYPVLTTSTLQNASTVAFVRYSWSTNYLFALIYVSSHLSHTHTFSLSLSHTHTHTFSLSLSLSLCLVLPLSLVRFFMDGYFYECAR
jgi:hypothetical protein